MSFVVRRQSGHMVRIVHHLRPIILCESHASSRTAMLKQAGPGMKETLAAMEEDEPEQFLDLLADFGIKPLD